MAFDIIVILLLILFNGFFSLAEMAIVSSRKARLKNEADKGNASYRIALEAAENPGRYLSAIQVAITLIGILSGALGGATLAGGLSGFLAGLGIARSIAASLSVGIIVIVTTLLSVVVGELVPKSLALAKPERTAARIIRPLSILTKIFTPVERVLTALTSGIVRLFGSAESAEPPVTEEEVKVLISQGAETGVFEPTEKEMVEGVLYLDDRRVSAFMTPRTDVLSIDISDGRTPEPAEIISRSSYAYLPMIDGDLDRTIGMMPVRDALAAIARDGKIDLLSLIKPPVHIPETISALRALSILKESNIGTALVADEYGGVAGVVTMADLFEPVLSGLGQGAGEEIPGVVQRGDGSWLVDGALPISEFAEMMRMDESEFDVNSYETVAGLVLDQMGSIPGTGESCEWNNLDFEIVDMDGNRIDKVLVSQKAAPGAEHREE